MEDLKNIMNALDSVLQSADISDVSAEGAGYEELPDGYYLGEVEKAELKESKSSHMPMVAFQFKVVEDGIGVKDDGSLVAIPKTKNRKMFIYYVLKDAQSVSRFASDMLKFEGETPGEPLLEKECFVNSELLLDALEILIGRRLFIQSSTTDKNGESSTWRNPISWTRAKKLGIVVE